MLYLDQGFRFVEPVSELLATSCDEVSRPAATVVEERSPAKSNSKAGKILGVLAAVVLLAAAGIWAGYFRHSGPARSQMKIAVLPLGSLGAGSADRQSNQAFTTALIAELSKSLNCLQPKRSSNIPPDLPIRPPPAGRWALMQ